MGIGRYEHIHGGRETWLLTVKVKWDRTGLLFMKNGSLGSILITAFEWLWNHPRGMIPRPKGPDIWAPDSPFNIYLDTDLGFQGIMVKLMKEHPYKQLSSHLLPYQLQRLTMMWPDVRVCFYVMYAAIDPCAFSSNILMIKSPSTENAWNVALSSHSKVCSNTGRGTQHWRSLPNLNMMLSQIDRESLGGLS